MFSRVATVACWYLVLVHGAADPPSCEVEENGTWSCSEPSLSKDQALLQLAGGKAALERKLVSKAAACGPAARRRRRNVEMAACRRRHSSGRHADLDRPWSQWKCNEQANQMECNIVPGENTGDDNIVGYPSSGNKKAVGLWCEVDIPPPEWNIKNCPATGNTMVKVLTYNLFWWNLFNRHQGGDRSAGRLIARTSSEDKYDIMGFQECEDVWRVLHDSLLDGSEYDAIDGGRAIAVAWRKTQWTLLGHNSVDVGEDSQDQYYGRRSAMWVRLRNNMDNKTVFFVNHHGPLRVSQTGGCTGSSTAMNIMKVIGENARNNDVIILVGDFNAALRSSRVRELEKRLHKVHSGHIFGGVDHIFSNCGDRGAGQTLSGGDGWYRSDHQALNAVFGI